MKARENPFRSARVRAAIRYAEPSADPGATPAGALALLPRLAALRYRAAIIGPHGSGKTTLLEDLAQVLGARGFRITHVRLDTDDPRLPRDWPARARHLGAADIVCVDGAEQLGPLGWARLRWQTREASGLIVTTHRPGRLPTLVACTTTPALLARIVRTLAPDAGFEAPPIADLFARHDGNVREALRELYDVCATMP